MSRIFLDSGVILDGIIARYGLSKAVLSLCAAQVHKLVLAEVVRIEVETNLLQVAYNTTHRLHFRADELIDDFNGFIDLARPEHVRRPAAADVLAAANSIRHINDAPVLASALAARPDWLLSTNTRHFNAQVANRTRLQIASPLEFFRHVHVRA